MNELHLIILKHYGHVSGCAKDLDLQPATVKNWIDNSPRNLLKHLPEISKKTQLPYSDVIDLVLARETEILHQHE